MLLLIFGANITAQEISYNRSSVVLTTGIHLPLSPTNEILHTEYIAFNQIQLAGLYMFSQKFGIKAHYAFNHFSDPDRSENAISLNRFGVEGVASLGKLLNVDYTIRAKLGLLFHTGIELTFANPSSEEISII